MDDPIVGYIVTLPLKLELMDYEACKPITLSSFIYIH